MRVEVDGPLHLTPAGTRLVAGALEFWIESGIVWVPVGARALFWDPDDGLQVEDWTGDFRSGRESWAWNPIFRRRRR